MLSKTWEGSSWKFLYLFFKFFLLSVIHILILPDEKISMGWVFVSGRVQGTFGYLGVGVHGILDCCWYKWQAVLLHTDQKCQAFVVVSKWTVYCIVLWVFNHIPDRRACDFKVSNVDTWSILVFVHSVVWEWMLSWWIVATCRFQSDLVHAHAPAFLEGIFPWAGNCIEVQNGFMLFQLPQCIASP